MVNDSVARLRTLHPYLETLPFLFANYTSDPCPSSALLLAVVIYISTLALPLEDELNQLRDTLTPFIIALRDSILLQIPRSFLAIQALEILSVHAPLGVLPVQLISPRTLGVARGQVSTAVSISTAVNFPKLTRHLTSVSQIGGPSIWNESDVWLWLSLCLAEGSMTLEDETSRKPASFAEAHEMVEEFWSPEFRSTWQTTIGAVGGAELISRLSVCDRISRVSEVLDSLARVRNGLETAAVDPTFDIVGATAEELKYVTERMNSIDTKHDAILGKLS